jgi:hypothetical protein
MSILKSVTLAAAVVIGFATFANAASYRTYSQANANTAAAAHFQDQFRNTY